MNQRTFADHDDVDFVVVGSGAAGGVLAKELSTSGFNVVVLEQGLWQQSAQFSHDELAVERQFAMLNTAVEAQTFRQRQSEPSKAGIASARTPRAGRADGNPVIRVPRTFGVPGLRALFVLRMRVRREVVVARDGDPHSVGDESL